MAAIKINSGARVHFEDVHFAGFDVGIEAAPGGEFTAKGLSFDSVRLPYNAGAGRADITGTRIKNDPKVSGRNTSFSGWHRPQGPPLPAFCPNCKSVFPSKNYNLGSSRFYGFDNEEVCPICGFEHARLSEGLFDLSKRAVVILTAPDMTHAMLAPNIILAIPTGTCYMCV